MKGNIITGQYIKEPARQELLVQSVQRKSSFNLLLQHFTGLADVNDLKLAKAYEFDGLTKENDLAIGKTAKFRNQDNTLQVDFFQKVIGNDVFETLRGKIVLEENGKSIIKGFEVEGTEVIELFSKLYEGELELEIKEEAPNDPNYEPGISKELIQQQGWTGSFCLYWEAKNKSYQHCGPDCGQWGSKGGMAPVNAIDHCCEDHDGCYYYDEASVACCDYRLDKCAYNYEYVDGVTQNQIWLVFGGYESWVCG